MNDLVALLQKRLVILPVWGWLLLAAHQLWRRMAALPKPAPVTRMEWGPKPLQYAVRYPQRWKIAGTGAATVVRFLGEVLGITKEEVEALIKEALEKVEKGTVEAGLAKLAEALVATKTETSFTTPAESLVASLGIGEGFYRHRMTVGFEAQSIAGMPIPAAGERDEVVLVALVRTCVFLNQSGSATLEGERFLLTPGESITLGLNETIRFYYDHTTKRWRNLGQGRISNKVVRPAPGTFAEPTEGNTSLSETGAVGRPRIVGLKGNGVKAEFEFIHNLNTKFPSVTIMLAEGTENKIVTAAEMEIETLKAKTANNLFVKFTKAPAAGRVIYFAIGA